MMSREYAASVVVNVTAIDILFGDDSSTIYLTNNDFPVITSWLQTDDSCIESAVGFSLAQQ
jgi:hypothetical protein